MRQEDEAGGPQDTGKAQEPEGSAEKAGSKKDKYQKAQAKAEHAGGKLGKAREKLDKTEAKRAAKKPPGLAKKAVRGARTEAWFYVHNKIHEVEHENVGVEGAHKSELAAEAGTRKLTRYAKRRWQVAAFKITYPCTVSKRYLLSVPRANMTRSAGCYEIRGQTGEKCNKIFPPRKHPQKSPECQAFGGGKS